MYDMTLVTLIDAHLAYGMAPLLDGAASSSTSGERIGLIGRNGTGKSRCLRIIAGEQTARRRRAQAARRPAHRAVEQEPALPDAPTLRASRCCARAQRSRTGDPWRPSSRLTAITSHRFSARSRRLAPAAVGRRAQARGARARASRSSPTCCCSTSRPTISTSTASCCSKSCCSKQPGRDRRHARPRLPRPRRDAHRRARPRRSCAPIRATSPPTSAQGRASSPPRRSRSRKFDKFWAQEEAWIRQGIEARRTRNEGRVRRLERCARSAPRGASASAT